MSAMATLRVPLAIYQSLSKKRDPLSRKIVEAYKAETRKEWGPEIQVSTEELDELQKIAMVIRRDPQSPVKMMSAANKLNDAIARLKSPPPVSAPAYQPPPKPIPDQSAALDEAMSRFIHDSPASRPPPVALPPKTASSLDAAMERFAGLPPTTPIEELLPEVSVAGLLGEDFDFSIMPPRRSALLRLASLYDLVRKDMPGVARLIIQIIESVKAI